MTAKGDEHVRFTDGPLAGQLRRTLVWPPPEVCLVEGTVYKRTRMSDLTDEQYADMTHVVRMAEYAVALNGDSTGRSDG